MMKKSRILTLLACAMMMAQGAWAVPANPKRLSLSQPDGTKLYAYLIGDEWSHALITADSLPIAQSADGYYRYASRQADGTFSVSNVVARNAEDRSEEETRQAAAYRTTALLPEALPSIHRAAAFHRLMGNTNVPSKGTFKGLVILANYQDMSFAEANSHDKIYRMMNEEGYADDNSTGSVHDFFVDQSAGNFIPSFDVVGPVTLSHEMAYYGSDTPVTDANAAKMIREACVLADSLYDVDFSQYDNNGDGFVDMVYVIYAGYSQSNGAPTTTIWPHMYYLKETNNEVTLDGVTVNCYATGGERLGTTGEDMMGIGLICHEFSHTLGLPDIYDTSTSYPRLLGMGRWDVMANGCYNNNADTPSGYSSFEKSMLGWLNPTTYDSYVSDVKLEGLGSSNEAVKIVNPSNSNDYYLLENRSLADKWDQYIPSEGLFVVHVEYDFIRFDQNQVNAQESGLRSVYMMSASGNNLSNEDSGAIPFPGTTGNTNFTDLTTPSAVFGDGTEAASPVTHINYSNHIATFDINHRPDAPVLSVENNIATTSFRANWAKVDSARYYTLRIKESADDDYTVYEKIQRNRFTVSGLSSTGIYTYQVRCQDDYAYSLWSDARTIDMANPTAVSTLTVADDGKVTYYNMQGCKVVSPRKGIYIVHSGNGITKKIMK